MILDFDQLGEFRNQLTMVDGSFDPIHEGHIEYFRQAAELGFPVLCNIAPDAWTSTKHKVLLPQSSRAQVIDAIRFISYVHESNRPTSEIIQQVRPLVLVKGKDWEKRGGIPATELAVCESHGIRIVYLDSVRNSSSLLLAEYAKGSV